MDIPDDVATEEIRSAAIDDEHLGILSEYVLLGCSAIRTKVQKDLQTCWSLRDEILIID